MIECNELKSYSDNAKLWTKTEIVINSKIVPCKLKYR